MRFLIFFVVVLTAGCSLEPLKIDPCAVYIADPYKCHAVPLHQPGKEEYDRDINPGDICVSSDEYAALQKSYRELRRRCGEKCE